VPTSRALFISRASADADFAAVVGDILKTAGYRVILQQWDFANRNFMQQMHKALTDGARVVALLSPEYLRSDQCQAEWQNAIAGDPLNTKSRLIVLRVAECKPVGLLSALAYWDLVPLRDNRALMHDIVLDAVRKQRRREIPSGPYWRAPQSIIETEMVRPVAGFSGRDAELEVIATALEPPDAIVVVQGLGGVGKSSIAREYAWRNRERYSIVWWLNAGSEDAVIDGLLRLGGLFVRGLEQHTDRRAAAAQVTGSVLSGFEKPVLLLFDNAEDERLLRSWQPLSNARLLATSRNTAWSADIRPVALTEWSIDTAVGYLQRESGRDDLETSDARAIVEALGALPLALAHASASLRGMRMVTPSRYLEHLGEYLRKAPRDAEYPRSVFATFSTAITNAEKEAPGAEAVLCFAARFAADAIPDELFRQPHGNYGDVPELRVAIGDEIALDDALGQLDRFSLLAYSPASRAYSMHRLVQRAALDRTAEGQSEWAQSAISAAESAFREVVFSSWPQCERLLPHARAALGGLADDAMYLPAGRLANRCGIYLCERGDYAAAEQMQRRALTILERTLGSEDDETGSALRDLAGVYYFEGHFALAESTATRALGVLENALGPDHPKIAMLLTLLAITHNKQGHYDRVEPLHLRALAIKEKAFGPDHPENATIFSNLGVFYHWQGRFDEAEKLLRRSLSLRETALGREHPDLASTINNLGHLYYRQRRYDELIPLLERALSISENALGPDHPDVAQTLNNLGLTYFSQGRYPEAEEIQLRALHIREAALGSDHPEMASTLNSLARIYEAQGRFEEAESLQLRTLEIREKTMGKNTTDVAGSFNDLGALYESMGRFDEALAMHERALAIRETALGPHHESVAMSLHHLAKIYVVKERHDDAKPLYVRALEIREKTLGPDHVLTRTVREELADLSPAARQAGA
jgi:tetratricopeptide (TPR) repeat protein